MPWRIGPPRERHALASLESPACRVQAGRLHWAGSASRSRTEHVSSAAAGTLEQNMHGPQMGD